MISLIIKFLSLLYDINVKHIFLVLHYISILIILALAIVSFAILLLSFFSIFIIHHIFIRNEFLLNLFLARALAVLRSS